MIPEPLTSRRLCLEPVGITHLSSHINFVSHLGECRRFVRPEKLVVGIEHVSPLVTRKYDDE